MDTSVCAFCIYSDGYDNYKTCAECVDGDKFSDNGIEPNG